MNSGGEVKQHFYGSVIGDDVPGLEIPHRLIGGALSVRPTGNEMVDGRLVVTLEARPRWWSWRYWVFRVRVRHLT